MGFFYYKKLKKLTHELSFLKTRCILLFSAITLFKKNMCSNFEIKRKKIIKRIVKYSGIFSVSNLSEKSLEELELLQKQTLIKLIVKMEYNLRHHKLNNSSSTY